MRWGYQDAEPAGSSRRRDPVRVRWAWMVRGTRCRVRQRQSGAVEQHRSLWSGAAGFVVVASLIGGLLLFGRFPIMPVRVCDLRLQDEKNLIGSAGFPVFLWEGRLFAGVESTSPGFCMKGGPFARATGSPYSSLTERGCLTCTRTLDHPEGAPQDCARFSTAYRETKSDHGRQFWIVRIRGHDLGLLASQPSTRKPEKVYGVSRPTAIRAVGVLGTLVDKALKTHALTADGIAERGRCVVDGILLPRWSWAPHPEACSGRRKTTGMSVRGRPHPRRRVRMGLGSERGKPT